MYTRRPHLILVGLILATLTGVALLGAPGSPVQKDVRQGLDLQGGLEIVLKAVPPKGRPLTQEDLARSVNIMRDRIDKLGVSEPEVRKQGADEIVIQLPGITDPDEAVEIIGKTAQLELYDLEANLIPGVSIDDQGNPRASLRLYDLLTAVQNQARKGTPEAYYLFNVRTKRAVAGPENTRAGLFRTKPARNLGKRGKVLVVPKGMAVITCGESAAVCPGVNVENPTQTFFYLFRYQPDHPTRPIPEMTGRHLKLSGTRQDFDPTTSQPIVLMEFTKEGGEIFHRITREEALRGSLRGSDQSFAIVLDRDIKSFPTINYKEYPDGIDPVNGAQITGIRSVKEARKLALVLQTGALPIDFKIASQTDVSATLGKDSLQQAQRAAIAGLLVVALFLLVAYRFLGLVAIVGLLIYAAFLYAAILIFGVTLTLPGFAGMILTIGVAADANIVVFERIKEEVRAGKSVRAAVATGYSKGFATILDANVVTCITALVLFAVATASVKGFALMLLIGTVISLVTAVAATRAMLGLLAGFKWFDNPRFMGAEGQQKAKWLQIDFLGKRRIWVAISAAVLLTSVGSLAVRGLNLGIDFKGGTQVTFKTPRYVALDDVRSEAAAIGHADAILQGRGESRGDTYRSFLLRMKSLTQTQQSDLRTDLETKFDATSLGVKSVSSSFGRQIAVSALLAIFVSLLLIVIYTAIRFDFKFSLPVVAALMHDVLITVGIYSLTAREVSTATVAAVLTVLGYSIYDTIIIFDRMRENIPLMRRASFATIANVSL